MSVKPVASPVSDSVTLPDAGYECRGPDGRSGWASLSPSTRRKSASTSWKTEWETPAESRCLNTEVETWADSSDGSCLWLSSSSILSTNASPTIRCPAYKCLSARWLLNSATAYRCPRCRSYAAFRCSWSARRPDWPRCCRSLRPSDARVSKIRRSPLRTPSDTRRPDNSELKIRTTLLGSDAG